MRPTFCIGERPDLTVLISKSNCHQNVAQDSVMLKLHKSVLGKYEYFKQVFATQPEVSRHPLRLNVNFLLSSKQS